MVRQENRYSFRLIGILVLTVLVLVIGIAGCGKEENNPSGPSDQILNINGVWEGRFQSSQSATQGIFCAKLQQDGSTLTGALYIAGQGYAGPISGEVGSESITFGVAGAVQFTGTVDGNNASGTYSGQGDTGTWSASKTEKADCDWAGISERNTFQNLLSTLLSFGGDTTGAPGNAAFLASTITRLPTTSVSIDGQQRNDWWICIWETENAPNATSPLFTLGAAFGPNPQVSGIQAGVIWGTPAIHQQNITFNNNNSSAGAGYLADVNTPNYLAIATTGSYVINADSDPNYQNTPILVIPNALGSGKTLEVRTATVNGYLEFTAVNFFSGDTTQVRLPASGQWQGLEILHLRFVNASGE